MTLKGICAIIMTFHLIGVAVCYHSTLIFNKSIGSAC